MRTKKSIRNFIFSLAFQVFMMVCGLIFPRWIILSYGSTINGLTQTINQIINYLNLLQAGAVGASVFALYKPVANSDYTEINSILYSTKRYFSKLGTVFFFCVIMCAPLLAGLKAEEGLGFFEVVIAVLILGINASFSFFCYSWYDTLFQSFQQQYLFTIAQLFERIVYYGLLIAILHFNLHFIFMYVALVFGGMCRGLLLYIFYCKLHRKMIKRTWNGSVAQIGNKGALLVNQIAIQIVDGAPTIIFSLGFGLKYASVFSVYYMIYGILKTIISTAYTSCNTAFANYVVTKQDEAIRQVFGFLQGAFLVLGIWMSFCYEALCLKFVSLYTVSITDINYFLPLWMMAGVLYIISYTSYISYYMLTNTYGLFGKMVKPAVMFAICSIICAVAMGKFIDMSFVIYAPTFYYFAMGIYRGRVAKREIKWFAYNRVIVRTAYIALMLLLGQICSRIVMERVDTWLMWIVAGVVVASVGIMISIIYSFVFERENMIYGTKYLRAIIYRKKVVK